MNCRIINLVAAAVTFAGAAILARPAYADTFDCTQEQWQAGEDAANAYCQGASYSISCRNNIVVVTILACPPGNG
ncbi:MAG TPA: hypothetical protein VGO40_03385 [Longimicrobium sp.]|jgi:hypothetical protein|nr:hypothetical protein [Longimicrobium sp.]